MKIIKQFLKWIGYLIVVFIIAIVAWLYNSPQFGGSPTEKQISLYQTTDHHDGESFFNHKRANMDMDAGMIWETLSEFLNPVVNIAPKGDIKPDLVKANSLGKEPMKTKITWFGHSSFLVEMDGKIVLLDPMFGDVASPHPWMGTSRYNSTFPVAIDDLPRIDVVVYSHDHYDHLDYGSVLEIMDRVDHWLVPWGMDNHLIEWGVDPDKITALDWWEESVQHDIEFALTPARHFSGRGITDRMTTLWGSWVIKGAADNVYFSGDGGYGDHFKEIGDKYGPFHIALMECGQYNYKWADIHMVPEETVQASIDVKAKVMMPIHWGAFTLSVHTWVDPVVRASEEADRLGVTMSTPRIGEQIIINETYPASKWWIEYLVEPL